MNRFVLIILTVFLFSCKNNQESKQTDKLAEQLHSSNNVALANSVIIIQNDTQGDTISIFRDLNFSNFLEDKHLYTNKKRDTLSIPLKQAEAFFVATNKVERNSILVNVGDTIFIQNDLNGMSWHANYDQKTMQEYKEQLQTSSKDIDSLTNLFYHIDYKSPFRLYSKFEKLEPIYPLVVNRERFKNNSTDLLYLVDLKLDRLSLIEKKYDSLASVFPSNASYYKLLKDQAMQETYFELNRFYRYSENTEIKKIISSDRFIDSKLENNSKNYAIMNTFINNVVLDNKKLKENHKLTAEYTKAFDSVSNYTDNKELLALFKILSINETGVQGGSKKEIKEMLGKFRLLYEDNKYDTYLSKIEHEYSLKYTLDLNRTDDVSLLDFGNTSYSLKDILNKNKGKLVYIDFWASWCAPCIAVMPDARKLADQFSDKEIAFIFLSIDKNKSQWERASIEEQLDRSSNNFIVLNYPDANLFKELKLQTIPRYILFDKEGKLVHENAPGPDTDAIRELLEKYLKE